VQRKATIVFFIFYFETFIFFMKTTEEVMLLIRKTSILVKILVENVTFFSCLSNECMKKTRDHLRCYFNLAVFLSDIFKPNVLLQLY